jgi:hypothetical protein
MSISEVLSWPDGQGWLVLSGGPHALGDVRALALSRVSLLDGEVVYVGLHADSGEELIDDLTDLGAPTGYLVNVLTEDDETIQTSLSGATLIVIPGETDAPTLRSALMGAALEGMRTALEHGAVILAEGPAAAIFGRLIALETGELLDGFDWLQQALVLPGVSSLADSEQALEALATQAVEVAVGIGVGSALALGPGGQVETWGERAVTVVLGGQRAT